MSETRVCSKCFEEKPMEEFGWKSMARGKRPKDQVTGITKIESTRLKM
ncbi:MAG: hypothetical protein L0287_11505 [Anaerolineae bacterium]|nr:hypothetical protein [Anaerolineae bacterium]MCI0609837.1 hypothetical protein [Anaerolineae bacterium]